jgi:hypothetical protein
MVKEFNFEIQSLEQLDEFQQFYCEKGLCHVIEAIYNIDSYQCEVIESDFCEGEIFYLEIGDKISLN